MRLVLSLLAVFILLCSPLSQAADYPQRAIKLIVTFPPGGGTDLLARKLAERLDTQLPQPIVVENRPGASGNIGARYVAQARADGYTLLMVNSTYAINPGFFPDLGFDPAHDLVPVSNIAWVPSVWVSAPHSTLGTVADALDYEHRHGVALQYGSCGQGTPQHLAAELLGRQTGSNLQHVPYNGCGPALNDVLAGHVESAFVTLSSASPYLRRGAVQALALTSAQRSQVLPQIPTMAESIGAAYDVNQWHAVFAPAQTPPEIITYLREQLARLLSEPQMQAELSALGYELATESAAQFEEIVQEDLRRYAEVVSVPE